MKQIKQFYLENESPTLSGNAGVFWSLIIILEIYAIISAFKVHKCWSIKMLKIDQYLQLHMKMTWRFHIKFPFTFWDMRTWHMWKVCLQAFRNNRICQKLAYFLRNLQTWRVTNSRILRIKNAKFSGNCFYLITNIGRLLTLR